MLREGEEGGEPLALQLHSERTLFVQGKVYDWLVVGTPRQLLRSFLSYALWAAAGTELAKSDPTHVDLQRVAQLLQQRLAYLEALAEHQVAKEQYWP